VQLYSFLLLIVSLGCGSLPPAETPLWRAGAASAGLVAGWVLLCHVAARICAVGVRRNEIDPICGAELLEKQLSAFRWLGLGVALLCLAGFGWASAVAEIPVVASSTLLQALLLLSPGMALLAGTWSAEHYYGRLLDYVGAEAESYLTTLSRIFRGSIGWLLVPVLLLLAINDAVALLPLSPRAGQWTTAIAVLLVIVAGVPGLIHRLLRTESLPAADAAWIADLLSAVGLGRTRNVRWLTGGQHFNALVAGFVPPLRTLLISDRLLDELPRDQVAMVVLHEAAHLRRKHMPLRMLAILPAWGSGALVTSMLNDHPWAMAMGTLCGALMTLLVLKAVAYATEHDADVVACRMAASIADHVADVPATYAEAASALSRALLRVTADQPHLSRPTWLHPGVAQRICRMRKSGSELDAGSPMECRVHQAG